MTSAVETGTRVTCRNCGHFLGRIISGMAEFWCKSCKRAYVVRASELTGAIVKRV